MKFCTRAQELLTRKVVCILSWFIRAHTERGKHGTVWHGGLRWNTKVSSANRQFPINMLTTHRAFTTLFLAGHHGFLPFCVECNFYMDGWVCQRLTNKRNYFLLIKKFIFFPLHSISWNGIFRVLPIKVLTQKQHWCLISKRPKQIWTFCSYDFIYFNFNRKSKVQN